MDFRILPFLRASVSRIFKRSQDLDVARDLSHAVLTSFAFLLFSIRSLTFNPRAKSEICIFSRSRDISWFQNLEVGHVNLKGPRPLQDNFAFFGLVSLTVSLHAKFEVVIFSHFRDIRKFPKFKSGSRDLVHAPFFTFFLFFYRAAWNADAV